MSYQRVLPRDLFNEAKLLKCIGRVCLNILDNRTPCAMSNSEMEGEEGFEICQSQDDGSLFISNLHISIKGKVFHFKSLLNSKANYPLCLEYEYCDYRVFDESGDWDQEFITFCESISEDKPVIEVDNMGKAI